MIKKSLRDRASALTSKVRMFVSMLVNALRQAATKIGFVLKLTASKTAHVSKAFVGVGGAVMKQAGATAITTFSAATQLIAQRSRKAFAWCKEGLAWLTNSFIRIGHSIINVCRVVLQRIGHVAQTGMHVSHSGLQAIFNRIASTMQWIIRTFAAATRANISLVMSCGTWLIHAPRSAARYFVRALKAAGSTLTRLFFGFCTATHDIFIGYWRWFGYQTGRVLSAGGNVLKATTASVTRGFVTGNNIHHITLKVSAGAKRSIKFVEHIIALSIKNTVRSLLWLYQTTLNSLRYIGRSSVAGFYAILHAFYAALAYCSRAFVAAGKGLKNSCLSLEKNVRHAFIYTSTSLMAGCLFVGSSLWRAVTATGNFIGLAATTVKYGFVATGNATITATHTFGTATLHAINHVRKITTNTLKSLRFSLVSAFQKISTGFFVGVRYTNNFIAEGFKSTLHGLQRMLSYGKHALTVTATAIARVFAFISSSFINGCVFLGTITWRAIIATGNMISITAITVKHGFVATGNFIYRSSSKIAKTGNRAIKVIWHALILAFTAIVRTSLWLSRQAHRGIQTIGSASIKIFSLLSRVALRTRTYVLHALTSIGTALTRAARAIVYAVANFLTAFFTTLGIVLTSIGKALVSPAAVYALLTATLIGTGWYGYQAGWFLFDTVPYKLAPQALIDAQEQKKLQEFSRQLEFRLTTTEQKLAALTQTLEAHQQTLEQTTQHEAQQLQEVRQSTELATQELQNVKNTMHQATAHLDNKIEKQGKALTQQITAQKTEAFQKIAGHKAEIGNRVTAHEQKVATSLSTHQQNIATKLTQHAQTVTRQIEANKNTLNTALDMHKKELAAHQKETAQKISAVHEKINAVDTKATKALAETQGLEKKIDHVQQLHETKIAVNKTIHEEVGNQVGALREEIKVRQKEKKRKEVLSKLIDQLVSDDE